MFNLGFRTLNLQPALSIKNKKLFLVIVSKRLRLIEFFFIEFYSLFSLECLIKTFIRYSSQFDFEVSGLKSRQGFTEDFHS